MEELLSLQQTVTLLCEEISNLCKCLKQQQENLTSVMNEYIRTVNELLTTKDKKIEEVQLFNAKLRASLTDSDTQILEEI